MALKSCLYSTVLLILHLLPPVFQLLLDPLNQRILLHLLHGCHLLLKHVPLMIEIGAHLCVFIGARLDNLVAKISKMITTLRKGHPAKYLAAQTGLQQVLCCFISIILVDLFKQLVAALAHEMRIIHAYADLLRIYELLQYFFLPRFSAICEELPPILFPLSSRAWLVS